MDKEEFYDSLEGDLSSTSNTSLTEQNLKPNTASQLNDTPSDSNTTLLIIKPPPENKLSCSRKSSNSSLSSEFENKCSFYCNEHNNQKICTLANDLSRTIPLYSGEKNIYDINKNRKCRSTSTLINNMNTQTIFSLKTKDDSTKKIKTAQRKQRSRNRNLQKSTVQVQEVRSKSYLKIFHNRIGYPTSAKKSTPTDTNRSICGDTKRSSITSNSTERDEFEDAEDNQCETASYYFRAIAESENPNTTDNINGPSSSSTFYSSSSCYRMASVSEIFSNKKTPKNKKSLYRYTRSKLQPIPVLGGLGPDTLRSQDKMELRKKQLNYGQKAIRNPLSPLPSTSNAINRSEEPSHLNDSDLGYFVISPAQLKLLPKIVGERSHVKRKIAHTAILTRTPYKTYLEEETSKETGEENKKPQKEKVNKKAVLKKKQKGNGVGRGMSKKRKKALNASESESSGEEGVKCLFCTNTFSKDDQGEGWIRCCVCEKWGHEACAGIDSDDPDNFICDLCT
ncbi:hypothetical protein RN001_006472 [Aquatica leii]|uniref:Zinc finger PHD-type domain-containing protein n=1 Tax=Aquatica leii TaxID=1421715 RepID=A0AAN7SQ83_9COLE|nr:hypothetical protein RN001_006472 [Aquatica leii]